MLVVFSFLSLLILFSLHFVFCHVIVMLWPVVIIVVTVNDGNGLISSSIRTFAALSSFYNLSFPGPCACARIRTTRNCAYHFFICMNFWCAQPCIIILLVFELNPRTFAQRAIAHIIFYLHEFLVRAVVHHHFTRVRMTSFYSCLHWIRAHFAYFITAHVFIFFSNF